MWDIFIRTPNEQSTRRQKELIKNRIQIKRYRGGPQLSLGTCGPTLFTMILYDCNLNCLSYVYMGKIKYV